MNRTAVSALTVVAAVAVGGAAAVPSGARVTGPMTGKAVRIASAESAAPAAVARHAKVVDFVSPDGAPPFRTLRAGTNGWTCFPDWAASPDNDPSCYDTYGMQWLNAYYQGRKPKLAGPGMAYRLQGGSDPSLTDPFATAPAPGATWVHHPAHVVIFSPGKLDPKAYGKQGGATPWVMWPGTPYAHLHVPVGDGTHHMG